MTINVEAVVACEDVRREANGKHFLIGVYSGSIVVPRLPFNLRPSWWIQIMCTGPEELNVEFRIVGIADAQLLTGELVLQTRAAGLSAVTLPQTPIQIQAEGPIRLQWRFDKGQPWETIKEMAVTIPNRNSATASKQVPEPTTTDS